MKYDSNPNAKKMNSQTMPVESYGQCIAMKAEKRGRVRCKYRGDLADGLCMRCWDRRQGTTTLSYLKR